MRWIEAAFRAPAGKLDWICDMLTELGADGLVIEDEADFRRFLEENHQYWDYVDDELEQQYAGVSRVKVYVADDADGRARLERVGVPRAGIRRGLIKRKRAGPLWARLFFVAATGKRC